MAIFEEIIGLSHRLHHSLLQPRLSPCIPKCQECLSPLCPKMAVLISIYSVVIVKHLIFPVLFPKELEQHELLAVDSLTEEGEADKGVGQQTDWVD